jgi:hypothetical protein
LPEEFRVYRGCAEFNKAGVCWSLDREVAAKFPFLLRYCVENPLLISATVQKSSVLAVKLDREEAEVITFAAVPASIDPLDGEE